MSEFTAGDMADAQAKAFREGAASLDDLVLQQQIEILRSRAIIDDLRDKIRIYEEGLDGMLENLERMKGKENE